MSFKNNKLIFILFSVILINLIRVNAQEVPVNDEYARLFDSINHRIQVLQEQIPRLKEARDASYYNVQRDLDLTLFVRAYEEYIMEEELDKARALVETTPSKSPLDNLFSISRRSSGMNPARYELIFSRIPGES